MSTMIGRTKISRHAKRTFQNRYKETAKNEIHRPAFTDNRWTKDGRTALTWEKEIFIMNHNTKPFPNRSLYINNSPFCSAYSSAQT